MSVVELFFLASFGYFEMWFGMIRNGLEWFAETCIKLLSRLIVNTHTVKCSLYILAIFLFNYQVFLFYFTLNHQKPKKKPFGGIVVIFFIKNKKHSYFESTIKTVSHKNAFSRPQL